MHRKSSANLLSWNTAILDFNCDGCDCASECFDVCINVPQYAAYQYSPGVLKLYFINFIIIKYFFVKLSFLHFDTFKYIGHRFESTIFRCITSLAFIAHQTYYVCAMLAEVSSLLERYFEIPVMTSIIGIGAFTAVSTTMVRK